MCSLILFSVSGLFAKIDNDSIYTHFLKNKYSSRINIYTGRAGKTKYKSESNNGFCFFDENSRGSDPGRRSIASSFPYIIRLRIDAPTSLGGRSSVVVVDAFIEENGDSLCLFR